jgi:protein-disulfide isomerase
MRMTCGAALLASLLLITGSVGFAQSAPSGSPAPDSASTDAPAAGDAAPRRIDQAFGAAWLGAPDGDVTLIVFVDYACPACRAAQPVIDQLIAADPHLKVVYRVLVNEGGGLQAARTSLAVAQSSADWSRFHRALDAAGAPTPQTIASALAQAGIDPHSLPPLDDDAMVDSPMTAELMNNDALINQRNGKAVPTWVLGDGQAQNGFELATLQPAIAKARHH